MKLKQKFREGSEYSIPQAVEKTCSADLDYPGAVEIAAATANNTAAMLGRLIEALHAGGALTDDAVLSVIDAYTWEATN